MKNKNHINDDTLRILMADTKVKASENLKYRIMQQISTEAALTRANKQTRSFPFKSIISILVTVSVIVIAYICFAYFGGDEGNPEQKELLLTYTLSICSILSFLTLIVALDTRIRDKKAKERIL